MNHAGYTLVVLTLFLLSAVSFAALQNLRLLTLANASCMLCIPLLGSSASIGNGHSIFTGAIFFPVGVFGLTLQYLIYGADAASSSVRYMLFSLVVVFGSMFLLAQGGMLDCSYDAGIRRVGVRFFFLYLAQSFLIRGLGQSSRVPALVRIPLLTATMHLIEGSAFYPCILIGEVPLSEVLDWTIQSLRMRLIVVVLSVPFLALVLGCRKSLPWLSIQRPSGQPAN